MTAFQEVKHKVDSYKKKLFLTQALKGFLFSATFFTASLILILVLEHYFWFGQLARAVAFFAFLFSNIYFFVFRVVLPVLRWLNIYRPMGNLEAARQLGENHSDVGDSLINTLQIGEKFSGSGSALALAAVEQKSKGLVALDFNTAISFRGQKRMAALFSFPFSLLLFLVFFQGSLISSSSERLINFNKEYLPPAPFEFVPNNLPDYAFRNEDLSLSLSFRGKEVPSEAFVQINGVRRKMIRSGPTDYSLGLKRVKSDLDIRFEGNGFYSKKILIPIHDRPIASNIKAKIDYPGYTGRPDKLISSMGHLKVPEGSKISWEFQTKHTEELNLLGYDSIPINFKPEKGRGEIERSFSASKNLEFLLINEFGKNKDALLTQVDVIKDLHPKIELSSAADSTLFEFVVLAGEILDDYGFSSLEVRYSLKDEKGAVVSSGKRPITFNRKLRDQNYFLRWDFKEIQLKPGQKLEYYTLVRDNDGVNGPKSSRSQAQSLMIPSKDDLINQLDQQKNSFKSSSSSSKESLKELQNEIKEFQDETRNKKELDWQDQKRLEDILEKHKKMEEELEQLKEDLEKIRPQEEKYLDQSEKLKEKTEQLEKLMEEVLDEETKKLMEELQKLLNKNNDNARLQEKLSQLERKDSQYEKELDRALELFKQLQVDQKLEQTIQDLNELAEEQDQLAKETQEKNKPNDQLSEDQEDINESFDKLKEEYSELEKLDEELESPKGLEDQEFGEQMEQLDQQMEQSKEMLDQGKNKKAGENQKSNSDQMKKLAESLMDFQQSSEDEALQEDLNSLRALLENLLRFSFEQERIMTEVRKVKRDDPRYIDLSQDQLKLQRDAEIIEDSLYALASRIFQIESFVTKEIEEMNYQMDESIRFIRERRAGKATIKQQFVMTSVNNLALMLDNVLKQLQEQMASQMAGDQMCSKPNGQKPSQSMSQLQKQLNQSIRELKKGGKEGRQLSEELSRLAQQQEMIRESLEQLGEGGNQIDKDLQKELRDLAQLMEETEKDLVHKRLTNELIERQAEIETRLLESEKADREREQKEERESEIAGEFERKTPPALEDYIKSRESQIELLKTINPSLNPYFKDKVNQYFEKLNIETEPRSN